jgi:SAM-dependent methyltransferase
MAKFNYSSYGAFKNSLATHRHLISMARRIGIKNRYLRFMSKARRDMPVIEIGCGDGAFIKDLLNAGFHDVQGVEPSDTYDTVVDPGLVHRDFAESFLQKLPGSSLGTIVAWDVFEHIPQAELHKLFSLMSSRLAQGGVLIFRVPNMASPLALVNYFGDLSHTTALNEISVRQISFETGLAVESMRPEPFAYPKSVSTLMGILLWPFFRIFYGVALAAFGIRNRVLTPNLVCILRKSMQTDASSDLTLPSASHESTMASA